jgi:hypothetical protein
MVMFASLPIYNIDNREERSAREPAEATTIYDFDDFGASLQPSTTTPNATSSDFHFDSPLGTVCGNSCGGYGHADATGAASVWLFDNVTLTATAVPLAAPVPEPTSMVLLSTRLLGAVAQRRRVRVGARVIRV